MHHTWLCYNVWCKGQTATIVTTRSTYSIMVDDDPIIDVAMQTMQINTQGDV
jgi:hypothetical protein